jgi:hypothetical protein
MSSFLNSIVRGAGSQIGRNIVGNFGKATTNNRYYERAQNEIEKALNLPIKGKADSIFGNCFTLYQAFDDECRTVGRIHGTSNRDFAYDILLRRSKITYYSECMEKIKDCKEYLELKGSEDETIEKIEQIKGKINFSFIKYVNNLCEGILTLTKKDDLNTARNGWYGYSDGSDSDLITLNKLYLQTTKNPEMIIKIENHLNAKPKSFWSNLFGR